MSTISDAQAQLINGNTSKKKEQIKNVLLSKFKKGLSMLFFLIQCKQ